MCNIAEPTNLKKENGVFAADVWKRTPEAEKNCEFETIIAAEFLVSKFLSLIGKSTVDYDLKKKIRKAVETITDKLHCTCTKSRTTHLEQKKKKGPLP